MFKNFIFFIFYELVLWSIALVAIPKMLYSLIVHKKYRKSLLYRFGIKSSFPKALKVPSIWIHAVSMGETKAIVSLARELKQRFPNHPLIISSVTETGHAEAKRSLPFADYHVYLPFDFAWLTYRIMKKACPKLVILCESDFWHNFLYYAKKGGAACALVNGKMSEKSMRRFSLVPFFSKPLFELFDLLCVQNTLYRGRLIEAGADSHKIVITGNLKLDEEYPQLTPIEVKEWRQKLGIQSEQIVLTIGSTHYPEEELIIQVLKQIWIEHPELRVIIVPRHPERFKEVGQLLEKERLQWINFSDIQRRTGKEQVILIDAMGLLRMCYQLSDFAIVCGSFTDRVGGHNILEPCWYGKPVIFGPHMHTQLELVELMKQYEAGKQVNPNQLLSILKKWVDQIEERKKIGANGLRLVKDLKGSVKRSMIALEPLFSKLNSTCDIIKE